jgi:hypothetical protein
VVHEPVKQCHHARGAQRTEEDQGSLLQHVQNRANQKGKKPGHREWHEDEVEVRSSNNEDRRGANNEAEMCNPGGVVQRVGYCHSINWL